MNRSKSVACLLLFAIIIFLAQACAMSKPMVKGSLPNMACMKAVRYETPAMKLNTLSGIPLLIAVGPIIAGSVTTSREEKISVQVSDYGYVLMNKFVERASKEIPEWPNTVMVNEPIKEDYRDKCPLLEFKLERILYAFLVGIRTESVVTLKSVDGEILWQDSFTYKSSDFNRKRSIDEYEADNYRLLREEIEFATNKTAESFLDNLKKGL